MVRHTQTLGVDTVWRCGPDLRNHVLAKVRKGPTLPMMAETEPIVLVDDYRALLKARKIVDAQRSRRGRPPNECISVVFGGPPPYCHLDRDWPESRAIEYLRAGFDLWLRVLGPETLIIAAVIHRDESAPHLHFVATTIHEGRVNWTAVQRSFLPRVPGKRSYTLLHTWFNEDVAAGFGLERGVEGSEAKHEEPDMVVAEACKQLRLRQIHQQRQLVRATGKYPCGREELQDPELWELELMLVMAQTGKAHEAQRVAEWRQMAKIPLPKAPKPSKEFLESNAKRRRIQAQLETAKEELERLEGLQLEDFLENQRHTDQVLAEMVNAWRNRVTMLKQALETKDFGAVEVNAEDDPVPGYSAEEWAEKKERLEEEAGAEMDSDDGEAEIKAQERFYDLGGDAEAEASNAGKGQNPE